jgi:hypothetical protein
MAGHRRPGILGQRTLESGEEAPRELPQEVKAPPHPEPPTGGPVPGRADRPLAPVFPSGDALWDRRQRWLRTLQDRDASGGDARDGATSPRPS